jgi:hypothetical protein
VSHNKSIMVYCIFHSQAHIHSRHGHVSVHSTNKERCESTSLLHFQAINGNASKAKTSCHLQNTQSQTMRIRLLASNANRHSLNVPSRERFKYPMKSTSPGIQQRYEVHDCKIYISTFSGPKMLLYISQHKSGSSKQ